MRLDRRQFVTFCAGVVPTAALGQLSRDTATPGASATPVPTVRGGLGLTYEEWVALRGKPDSWTGGDDNRPIYLASMLRINLPTFAPGKRIEQINMDLISGVHDASDARPICEPLMPPDTVFEREVARGAEGIRTFEYSSAWLKDRYAALPADEREGRFPPGGEGTFILSLVQNGQFIKRFDFATISITDNRQ
ncbi:MAG: hypothetical protein QM589_16135 [Thermomicrobiales bacterium]